MIKVNRILVHCDKDQCIVNTEKDLEQLQAKISEELKIPASQITFTYEKTNDDGTKTN